MAKSYTVNRQGVADLTNNYYWQQRVPTVSISNPSQQTNKPNQYGGVGNEPYGPVNYLGQVVNFDDFTQELYNKYYNQYSSGYGGYTPVKGDISELLKSFENYASTASGNAEARYQNILKNLESSYNTSRADAETSYNNKRSDLLTSLKRYQQQFEKDTQAQRQAFLTNQAALESTREAANRSLRNSMAARGLGGSGLQQLAMLQNVLGQSAEVSKLANQNQTTMYNLRNLLNQQQEDYDTDIARAQEAYDKGLRDIQTTYDLGKNSALTERDTTLADIAADLVMRKQNAITDNENRYIDAVNSARAQAAAYSAQAKQNAQNLSNQVINAYNTTTSTLASQLENLYGESDKGVIAKYANDFGFTDKKGKEYTAKSVGKLNDNELRSLKQLIANTYAQIADEAISGYSINYGTPVAFNQTAQKNINNLLQGYGYNPYYTQAIINGQYIRP